MNCIVKGNNLEFSCFYCKNINNISIDGIGNFFVSCAYCTKMCCIQLKEKKKIEKIGLFKKILNFLKVI